MAVIGFHAPRWRG
ncbi:hypothetical protein OVA11_03255 [Caulobacter sp. SL161]|nr:hypothetical protein [Caulobacter sp. SL161]